MDSGTRGDLLWHLAGAVGSVKVTHPVRVAVDGRPAAGKTTLADELADVLRAQGREVIRASIDDFLFPRAQRYRRGMYSAEGNYHDSFDFGSMYELLLDPLGPGGNRRFQPALRDRLTDASLAQPPATASADAVLLFDGVFLMRPELIDRWELRILVLAQFEETLDRARVRDHVLNGSVEEVDRRFHNRYGPSQQHYFATVQPATRADIIVHNDKPQQPAWEVRS